MIGAFNYLLTGVEAGGHGMNQALPLMNLLPAILNTLAHGPPVLAAGGLATGSHIAAMLALGAAGCVFGTRFLLTPEVCYTPAQKAALVAATGSATVRSVAFDDVRGTAGWSAGVDGRGLRNKMLSDADNGMALSEMKLKMQEAVAKDDAEYLVTWAGTGVTLMNEVKPVAVKNSTQSSFYPISCSDVGCCQRTPATSFGQYLHTPRSRCLSPEASLSRFPEDAFAPSSRMLPSGYDFCLSGK